MLIFASRNPSQPLSALESGVASHSVLTAMHIIPAALFVLVAAKLLLRPIGGDWQERIFFLLGAFTGLTAYGMSVYAGGGVELSAVLVFNTWFLWSLVCAYWCRVRGERVRKRAWMTRAVGVLLGIATTRAVMVVFFATSARTHLRPNQFFGIAFWVGFSINMLVAELWLRSKRREQTWSTQASAS